MNIINAIPASVLRDRFENEQVLDASEQYHAEKAKIIIDLEPVDKMLKFSLQQITGTRQLVWPDPEFGSYIAVPSNTNLVLTLELSDNWKWYFSEMNLFPKDPNHDKFFHFVPNQWNPKIAILHLRNTGKPNSDPQHHKFNICVDMVQPDSTMPLALVIDPDVKNPPPVDPPLVPLPHPTDKLPIL